MATGTLLTLFITECELVFELQPSRFQDERTRASYMISLLRDTPLLAIRPIMSALPRAEMLDDHKKLIEYLRINYGDPDEKGTARRKLKGVRQNGSASAYFAELQQYIAILGWKEQEQIVDRAIDGLKPHLKDEIARSGLLPQTLAELIDFVIPLDNRLYERDIERKHEGREQAKTTTRVLSSTTVTTPISTSRPFASYRDQTTKETTGLGKTTENVVHTSRPTAPATYLARRSFRMLNGSDDVIIVSATAVALLITSVPSAP